MLHLGVALMWVTAFRTGDVVVDLRASAAQEPAAVSSTTTPADHTSDASPRGQDAPPRGVIASLGRILIAGTGDEAAAGVAVAPGSAGLASLQQAGWHTAAVQAAEAEVAYAWAALRQARAEQARVLSSPEIVTLTAAEQALAQAQARTMRADVDLQRLSQPDPVLVDAAERALWRAEATLRAARSVRPANDPAHNPVGQAWEIREAEVAAQDARQRRDALLAGSSAEALAAARAERDSAQAALHEATVHVEHLRQGVASAPLNATNAAVLSASAGLTDAEARLHSLRSTER